MREPGSSLEDWYQTALGQAVLQVERDLCAPMLTHCFGQYALQVGYPETRDYLENCPIPHRVCLTHEPVTVPSFASLCAETSKTNELPFQDDVLDLVCLPHTLEVSNQPYDLLSEALRVLVPDGYLLLIGFSPRGFWGLRHCFQKHTGSQPWARQLMGLSCLQHWLLSSGCEITTMRTGFYRPPFERAEWLSRFLFLESWGQSFCSRQGGVYVILAQKKIVSATPIGLAPGGRRLLSRRSGIGETS